MVQQSGEQILLRQNAHFGTEVILTPKYLIISKREDHAVMALQQIQNISVLPWKKVKTSLFKTKEAAMGTKVTICTADRAITIYYTHAQQQNANEIIKALQNTIAEHSESM